jgi:hypothetical protein
MEDITTALKEWAVVQRSLLEGHQIMLIRKGGLIEENGEFALQANRFLIYPTYEHETERLGDVQDCFGKWLLEEEAARPAKNEIRFAAFAEVTDIIKLEAREPLIRLSPTHIWKEQFINLRFDWEPYKPVYVVLLRAYRLPEPIVRPYLEQYGGCRSWIELAEPILTDGSAPAISEEFFNRRRELTLKVLAG